MVLARLQMPNRLTRSLRKDGNFSIFQSVLNRRQLGSNNQTPAENISTKTYYNASWTSILQTWQVDVDTDPNLIFIDIQFDTGLLQIYASRKRILVQQAGHFLAGLLAVRF